LITFSSFEDVKSQTFIAKTKEVINLFGFFCGLATFHFKFIQSILSRTK